MVEVEVKARIQNPETVVVAFQQKGWAFSKLQEQEDLLFLPNGIEVPTTKLETPMIRIRTTNGKHILTLKKKVSSSNKLVSMELETEINDPEAVKQMLLELGFHEALELHKVRRESKNAGIAICVDTVAGLGSFVEVEKITTEDPALVQEELYTFLESVGILRDQRVFEAYDTLLWNATHERKN